ncbi:uncharacterized protein LOC110008083 [Amborella trichopoda]|uniref:uncharacterized protein LOC110008083 n=1 Tax=Amborella trichopoda TaxID=13333 RepID=UPI0009BFF821|nr:uncharacterized protein LOC110008083 [Amborella trichopoda]|eukprot:XP_020529086.1 uncharacterized protein LOC110008083 [Amborella trichopoda]
MGLETLPLAMVMTEIRKRMKVKEVIKEKVPRNADVVNPVNDVVCTPVGKASVKAKGKKIFRRGFRSSARLEARGIPQRGYLNAGVSFREPELMDVGSSSSSSTEDEDWESMDLTVAQDGVGQSGSDETQLGNIATFLEICEVVMGIKMSVIQMPALVAKRIEKLMRDFL